MRQEGDANKSAFWSSQLRRDNCLINS